MTYFYYLDCMDGIIGEKMLTAAELNKLETGGTGEMSEKDIKRLAANYEASLYRYEKDTNGNYTNEICLYDCEI